MIDFEALITKYAGEDGNIPADAVSKAANAIASAVGREFVAKDRYAAKLDEIEQLTNDKQTAEDNLTTANKWKDKFDKEHEAFEEFKAATDAKERESAKREAVRKVAKDAGLSEAGVNKAVKYYNLEKVELDKDGNAVNADKIKGELQEEWADFKVTTHTKGANVENPPANNGKAKRSKEEILAIKDTKERQQAIAENHEIFGF